MNQVEAVWMDSRLWGSYTATQQLNDADGSQHPTLKFMPILTVTSLVENLASLDQATNYSAERTEGPGSSSSFIILTKDNGSGIQVGYALFFYNNIPTAGRNKLRVSYTYGHNLPTSLLTQYATYRTAMRVIEIRAASGSFNINLDTGPWAEKYKQMKDWTEKADRDWPRPLQMAIL